MKFGNFIVHQKNLSYVEASLTGEIPWVPFGLFKPLNHRWSSHQGCQLNLLILVPITVKWVKLIIYSNLIRAIICNVPKNMATLFGIFSVRIWTFLNCLRCSIWPWKKTRNFDEEAKLLLARSRKLTKESNQGEFYTVTWKLWLSNGDGSKNAWKEFSKSLLSKSQFSFWPRIKESYFLKLCCFLNFFISFHFVLQRKKCSGSFWAKSLSLWELTKGENCSCRISSLRQITPCARREKLNSQNVYRCQFANRFFSLRP